MEKGRREGKEGDKGVKGGMEKEEPGILESHAMKLLMQ